MSDTTKTKRRRQIKKKNGGQDRKKALAKNGTTPVFAVHQAKA
jgi:hypothetical protein